MDDRSLVDLKTLKTILSLKHSKERIQSLCTTIQTTDEFLKGVNADLEKGIRIQQAYNKVLKESITSMTSEQKKPILRLVVDNTKNVPIREPVAEKVEIVTEEDKNLHDQLVAK